MPTTKTTVLKPADHPIKSVTVFKSSKAEVVRTFLLDLKKGQNKIEICGLPSTIDTHSVRVSGLGDNARLFDVVCTISAPKSPSYSMASPANTIRTLNLKRAQLESEKRVRNEEAELLLSYGKTLSGEHVAPDGMTAFLDSFVKRSGANLDAIANLNRQINEIDLLLESENNKSALKKGTTHGEVTIVIVADEDSSVNLKLTYIVSNVSWKPTYELHATTLANTTGKPSPHVTLHYRARITQSTGEDWVGTALTLSTIASDAVAKGIPQLECIKIVPQIKRYVGGAPNKGFFIPRPQPQPFANANTNTNTRSLFGSNVTNSFGSTSGQSQQHQQASGGGGGLFSQSSNPSGFTNGLFGQSQQPLQQLQQQQQQQAFGGGSGLFGQSSFPTQQQPMFQAVNQQSMPQTQQHQPQQAQSSGFGAFGSAQPPNLELDQSSGLQVLDDFEDIPLPEKSIAEPTTIVTETPMAISYSVHGESTIPSDGVDHQVSVAVLPFEAKISYVVIPRIDPRVYLQCEVKNTSEYRLLPGPVSVILDDSYVSKTAIYDINTGDIFDCTLGNDPSTKVTYFRTSKTVKDRGGTFSEETNITTYTTKISIHNKHQFAIHDLIVRDVIPTSDDKRAKVVLRKPSGLAEAKNGQVVAIGKDGLKVMWEKIVDGKGGEKEGKFEWRWKVDGGAKVTLDAEWEIKSSSDVTWVESTGTFFS